MGGIGFKGLEMANLHLDEAPLEDLTDEELVTAHLQGRPGAFQRLYDRYRDRLIHFITRKTGDPDRGKEHLRTVVHHCADHPVAAAYLEQADPSYRRAS